MYFVTWCVYQPHRCWAGYQPQAGDTSASILSCTASSTCNNPKSTTGKNVLCDACELENADDFMKYACSPLTKHCTCGIQKFERTRCTTHEQCYSATSGASCMRMSNVFSTAFSTVPCAQCTTQQVCVVNKADAPGYCACPFIDVEVQTCRDIGEVAVVDSNAYCSFLFNGQIRSTRNTYIGWKDLTITPCAILDTSSIYCYRIDASGRGQVRRKSHFWNASRDM